MVLEEARLEAQLQGVRARVADRGPRRLFHDLADLSRQRELAAALHQDRLNRHHVAAVLVHGHAGDGAYLVLELGDAELEAGRAQVAHQVAGLDHYLLSLAFGDPAWDL